MPIALSLVTEPLKTEESPQTEGSVLPRGGLRRSGIRVRLT